MTPKTATAEALLDHWAMSLLSSEPKLLALARRLTEATGAPVLGGISVFLHGYRRTTEDIDLFAARTDELHEALIGLGAEWDAEQRELRIEGVPVHLVTESETGSAPSQVVEIQGVRVVGLADLIRFKLHSGLGRPERSQDIADVVELIRRVPLEKSFAGRLPREQRAPFKKLVDAVRGAVEGR